MKKRDLLKEYREASVEELKSKIDSARHELMNLRFRHASGQLAHSAQLRNVQRGIARAETVLRQRDAEGK